MLRRNWDVRGENAWTWRLHPRPCRKKLMVPHALGSSFQLGRSTVVTVDELGLQRDMGDAHVRDVPSIK